MRVFVKFILGMVFTFIVLLPADAQQDQKPILPIGIFLGRIEEGARIFTPVRLLPFDNPESEGHQFPNALQLYGTELDVLLWLGHQTGFDLRATLTRYPKEPSPDWPYKDFSPPDTSILRSMQPIRRPSTDSPLKGLRAVLFHNNHLMSYIVDTRNLTLEERGMRRATTMGLEINRADFLTTLDKALKYTNGRQTAALIFEK